ncbi:LytR/AlgR family response regulator transcription factor [Mucilaginibacter myungsuensis]|uniref:Response regulator transcription factor n=1 Tax=Mucilaginibacter myungsuensis TaxID=649104 RepID=A0A929PZ75_9SPHI|nr:LytTR family DNA-binding domain-containing protein [Mucilaginibacter myungsuensis]MBE9664117.1 response regulator transcription factor [Mucilaginibacter myungsuensis]MDN3601296.1 LytTR family DNA-binding domain-containing protein [Mucilaginibacter myungsuensis]
MISAILVDDETLNISNLSALLARHCPGVQIIATATHADEARELIMTMKPDVVFLDIEMPGKNGFELLRSIPDPDFEVIFVTAYDTYGIMAVKFSALDYLLKPINTTELKDAVERAEASVQLKKQNLRLGNLLQLLDKKQPDENEKIALPTLKETYLVPVKDIVRCESSNNYTTFYLANGAEHIISKPLYAYDEMLTPYGFIRCHQSHLVNKAHIVSILNEDSGYLIMQRSDKKVPISKQKKSLIKTLLKL